MQNLNQTNASAYGLTLLRIVVGIVFVMHGGQKLFVYGLEGTAGFMSQTGLPFPMLSAIAAITAEFVGGLFLVAGAFTRWVTPPLAFTMVVAAVTVHLKGFFLPAGFEYTLVLFAASVALGLAGPGAFAVDNILARRRSEKTGQATSPAMQRSVPHVEAA